MVYQEKLDYIFFYPEPVWDRGRKSANLNLTNARLNLILSNPEHQTPSGAPGDILITWYSQQWII